MDHIIHLNDEQYIEKLKEGVADRDELISYQKIEIKKLQEYIKVLKNKIRCEELTPVLLTRQTALTNTMFDQQY